MGGMASVFWKNSQELQKYQLRTLRALLRSIWHRSAFYRELYANHGIREADIDHLTVSDLPLVSKQTLRDNFDSAVTDSRLKKTLLEAWIREDHSPAEDFLDEFIIVHTSGTSGYRAISPCDRTGYQAMTGIMAGHLPPPRARKTRIAIYRGSHGNFNSTVSAARLPKSVYDVFHLSLLEPTQQVIERLNAFQPDRLEGHSSSVTLLAEHACKGTLRIRPEQILVSGDALTENMERIVKSAWDVPLFVLYTCSESFCLAVRYPGQGNEMTVLDDLNIVEVLGDNDRPVSPGDQGRIVITNLFNHTLPILRYELGDYAVRAGYRSDSPFSRIRHLIGRQSENLPVLLRDGTEDALNPLILHEFCETGPQNEYRVSGLEYVQFISKRPDLVEIQYTSAASIDAAVRAEFQRLLDKAGAARTRFDVRRVANIAPNPQTGKRQLVRFENARPVLVRTPQAEPSPSVEVPAAPVGVYTAFPIDASERSIPERFAEQVGKHPDRLAVKADGQEWTYDDLNRLSNQVARRLIDAAGAGAEPVALFFENGASVMAAILGVLKAGKFYVPLDTAYPAPRIASILTEAGAKIFLTDKKNLAAARAVAGGLACVVDIEALPDDIGGADLETEIGPEAFALMIYTSGSTGQPKGVTHNHRNILHNTLTYTDDVRISPNDRIALLRQVSVLGASRQIFGALLNGASLFPYDVRQQGTAGLASWLNAEKITDCFFSGPLFRHFLETLTGREEFPALRQIELGSDAVRKQDVERYQKVFSPRCVLMNGLSSTEAGTVRRYFIRNDTQIPTATVPVGYPVADMDILLVDENGQPVPSGEVGEIVVRSRYLSPGYWQKSDLTEAAFSEEPGDGGKRLYRTGDLGRLWPDGLLEHLGRKDSRVKIRGYRVELSEVEQALLDLAIIKDAVVTAWKDDGDSRLAAYLVPARSAAPSAGELRRALRKTLPEHMIPSAFVVLDALPLSPNGKLDRKALPAPDSARQRLEAEAVPPRTPIERVLSEIWTEILGLDSVGVSDHFLDLGGDSLRAGQIISRVNKTYGMTLPFRDFFEQPTIESLALLVLKAEIDLMNT